MVSIQDIQASPQDSSNFYLANIQHALTSSNISLPSSPPPFTPPTYAIWVNALWFMSLVLNLTCAILANLLQQWARRYLEATQTDYVLHRRAHTRAFYAEGVKKFLVPWVFEALPAMLHLSVFFFFAGLVVFLWKFDHTISQLVLSWVSLCTVLYGCATFVPIFRQDSPYSTPLTPLARYIFVAVSMVFVVIYIWFCFLALCCSRRRRPGHLLYGYLTFWLERVLDITFVTPEEADKSSAEVDCRAFLWTLSRLDEDHELERFFSGLPGFYNSKALKKPLRYLTNQQMQKLMTRMVGFLDRSFSSDLLPDYVKRRRVDICANATDVMPPQVFPEILHKLVSEDSDGYGPLQSTETVQFFRRRVDREGEDTAVVDAMFSIILARVQVHDDSWFTLASDDLGIPESILRSQAAHGDSLSFAILIHITRRQFIHLQNPSWPSDAISNVLEAASKFNVSNTSPELQHEFCALWNQMVNEARPDLRWQIASDILKPIRKVYIVLHQDTDSAPTRFSAATSDQNDILDYPSSYPLCKVAGHSPTDSHNNPVPSLTFPTSPDVSPSCHVHDILVTVPTLDNSYPIHQPANDIEISHTPLTPTNAGAIHTVASAPYPTPETSTSGVPPHPTTSPPASGFLQHHSDPMMPSGLSSLPSTTSNPVLDTITSTGLSPSTYSILTLTVFSRIQQPCRGHQCTERTYSINRSGCSWFAPRKGRL